MSGPKKLCLMWLLIGLVVAVATPIPAADKPPCNVILFGWDGAQRDHVNEMLARDELPTLKKIKDEGSYVEIDIEGTTDTKAGWSQILTGYYPTVTGVWSNGHYQPIPEGLSIAERLEKRFGDDNIVTVSVIGKKGHVDADPPKKIKVAEPKKPAKPKEGAKKPAPKKKRKPPGKIIEEDGVKYRVVPGKPHYHLSQNSDFFQNGLSQNEKVGNLAIEMLEKHKDKPFFFFVHFADPDHSGHGHGENSKHYNDAIISDDVWTGKILDKIKELGLADNTVVYITADHGFDEGGKSHRMAPYVFLASSDKNINRNGLRQDVAPTILEKFGFDLAEIEPKLDGISLTQPDNRSKPTIGPKKNAELGERGAAAKKPAPGKRPKKKKPEAAKK